MNDSGHNVRKGADVAAERALVEAAGAWIARRDRGLTPAEQLAFAAWLAADPRHGARLKELQRSFVALDRLRAMRPSDEREPDPDLLVAGRDRQARRRGTRLRFPVAGAVLAAAAAIAIGVFLPRTPTAPAVPAVAAGDGSVVRHMPEKMSLADGSVIELKRGANVDVNFTVTERHVRLTAGEAHFTVTKDAARPFVVDAGGVAVRAVGTAFRVSREQSTVGVIVTEGRVSVDDLLQGKSLLGSSTESAAEPALLHAGQGVSIARSNTGFTAAAVAAIAPDEIERALAWRNTWLEFNERTLAGVVDEFNQHNTRKLQVQDEATGRIVVTGSFRADGVDAFVRLLESSFGVTATPTSDQRILLRKTP